MAKPVLIYFRHTPKGVMLFPSYDVSPLGETKKRLAHSDEGAKVARYVMDCVIGFIKLNGGFDARRRPDFGAIVAHLKSKGLHPNFMKMMCGDAYDDVVFLPKDGRMGDRILIKPTAA